MAEVFTTKLCQDFAFAKEKAQNSFSCETFCPRKLVPTKYFATISGQGYFYAHADNKMRSKTGGWCMNKSMDIFARKKTNVKNIYLYFKKLQLEITRKLPPPNK